MRDNTITAHVGEKTYVKTDPAFQYDYGLKLIIDGVELPVEYEVQFGNTTSHANKTAIGDATGVLIPDEYLLNGEDIHAYLYMHTEQDDGYSVYHIHIPVIGRAAIAEEEITPIQHDVIEEALEALADAVEKTDANVHHYPYINEYEYWMSWDSDNEEFYNTGVKASGDDSNVNPIHDEQYNQQTVIIRDGARCISVDDLIIAVDPIQDGSGIPSPRNIRRITGVTGFTFTHTDSENEHVYQIHFGDDAGTVYGGTYYPMTGKLVVDRVLITKSCINMNNKEIQPGWKDAGIRDIVGDNVSQVFTDQFLNIGTSYGVDTTGDNDILYLGYDEYHMRQTDWINTEINVQVCVMLAEPLEYDIQTFAPAIAFGNNSYSVDHGKIKYIKYPCDTKLYIDQKVAELQALILEH